MQENENSSDLPGNTDMLIIPADDQPDIPEEKCDDIPSISDSEQNALDGILNVLLQVTKVDFSHYRKPTIFRRLTRRIGLCKKNNFSEYFEFIKDNTDEIKDLYNDLLLSYTEFFREPSVFEKLKKSVFPKLIKHRSNKDTIRIWVPGCSTGEEVYSLAIYFYEFLNENNSSGSIKAQFFGTDLNPKHITRARTAIYSEKIRKKISENRIENFFDQASNGLKVTKHIREMCIFAVQNVTLDPPFSNIDMISCRNVLIYFDAAFQEAVIPLFHFSLRKEGFLLLGSSETMGKYPDLFTLVDQKTNLYSKRFTSSRLIYNFPTIQHSLKIKEETNLISSNNHCESVLKDINRQIDAILLGTFSPPCILIDSHLVIRQFRGHTFPYLEPVTGEASLKLSKMAGDGLMPELYVAIEEAKKSQDIVKRKNITIKREGIISSVDISVIPIQDHSIKEQCFLVLFEKSDNHFTSNNNTHTLPDNNDELTQLRSELQTTKEHLQSIIEEKDEVNQELWASNEEVLSINEELQSVNEEIEAAKEELESSNEELIALNEEMLKKNIELRNAKDFSENIVETANAIVVIIDIQCSIIVINKFTETLTGFSRDSVVGKNWFDIFIPFRYRNTLKPILSDTFIQKSDIIQYENPILIKDGSERMISWSNSAMKDHSGKVCAVLIMGMDITEYRNAQKALMESEEKYRNLVETSQDLIWQCDLEGRYTYLNPAWEITLGFTIEEMLGKKFSEFQTPEIAKRDTKKVSLILEENFSKGHETIHISNKGEQKCLIFNAAAICDETGKKIGVRGTAHDITDWKKAEYKYQLLFNEMLDGFALHEIIFDKSGTPVNYKFLAVNPAFERITGLNSLDIIGKKVLDILPEINRSIIGIYGKVAQTGQPVNFDYYSDDLKKYFSITAFRPAANQFACIFIDITHRKRTEKALQESIARFDQLAEQTLTFIWEVDANGLYTFVSPIVEQILGFRPEDLIDKLHFYDLHQEKTRESFKTTIFSLFGKRERLIDLHNLVISKDGKAVWLSTYGTPILNSNGELSGYRGGDTDITDRKFSEEIRIKLEQQHQQTQRLESLGILAGGIAHDFNNLLGGIFGFIDLAIDECNSPKASQYLTTALATIDRARSLTQQLLTFSKGGAPVQSAGYLFPYIKETVQFVLSGSNISCIYDIQKELWPCNYDKNQIGQVIDNIIINAQQAMPSGGIIELTARNIQLEESEHPLLTYGNYIKISIKDYGIGIPEDMLPHIFDPFFTTKAKGHGLGLATCHSIISRHGGYIKVESKFGKGCTFHIFLPACSEPINQTSINVPSKHTGNGIFLVMDDEEVIRMTIATMMTSFGYTVICKDNGKDTISWFLEAKKENKFIAAMIFDLTIPGGMGGMETLSEIRKLDKNIPVFVSSGYADDPIMSNPKEYGFTSSICKPFRMSELIKLLNENLT